MYLRGPPSREVFLWKNMERRVVTHSTELLDPERVAHGVSAMIVEYNQAHPFEMLPKTPDIVLQQLDNGLSVVLVSPGDEEILFHGSLYPNFENEEEKLLGYQVIELGSWMVPTKLRGHNLGRDGVAALLELGRKNWDNPLFLSTHKRVAALKVSDRNDLYPIDYTQVPYLSYLTCTCVNCSERVGFQSCKFRRRTLDITVYEEGKIDCTVVVSSLSDAAIFEERCRELHKGMGENPLIPGEQITVESMGRAYHFFDNLKSKV